MGLSLNSDEVQRNLALLPVADNVSVCICCLDALLTSYSIIVLCMNFWLKNKTPKKVTFD